MKNIQQPEWYKLLLIRINNRLSEQISGMGNFLRLNNFMENITLECHSLILEKANGKSVSLLISVHCNTHEPTACVCLFIFLHFLLDLPILQKTILHLAQTS